MRVRLDQPLRVEYEPGCDRGDRLRGPGDVGDGAWRRRTRPERGSVLVARAHNHLATSGEAESIRRIGAHGTGDLVRRTDPGQLVRLDARGGEHRLGPRTRPHVVEERGRGVGVILGDHPGQPAEEVPADRGHYGSRPVDLRLLVAKPHDLRGDVRGVRVEAGRREHPVGAHLVRQGLGLGRGPAIEPDDAVAQRPAQQVDGYDPVDLARESEVSHRRRMQAGGRHQPADDLLDAVLPRGRSLVSPARSEIRHVAGGTCDTEDLRLGREQDALHTLGSDIDTDDVAQLGSFVCPDCPGLLRRTSCPWCGFRPGCQFVSLMSVV